MNRSALLFPATLLTLAASAYAQGPDFLLTYSQPETTSSGSAGTVLRFLHPNEIAHLEWSNGPCSSLSAEKWAPRTCFNTMAGDDNFDSWYWNPSIFSSIDALMTGVPMTPVAGTNPRTIFFSTSGFLGAGVSGVPFLRPGDVGRIVRNGAGDGQVEYFMSNEQFCTALGLSVFTPLDVDAVAFAPGFGVYFSLDADVFAVTACGPVLVQDGAVVVVPTSALTFTSDFRIASVAASSAVVLFSEAQMDAFAANAQMTDRFGNCITNVVDTESIELEQNGPIANITLCPGNVVQTPHLVFSAETMTGAGLATTAFGGSIHVGLCGPNARSCGGASPTLGLQMGIRPTTPILGAPSWIDAIASTQTWRYSMEAQQHVASTAGGLPFGWQDLHLSSPVPWNIILWTPAPVGFAVVAPSFTNPFGFFCFPDLYPMPNVWMAAPTIGGFATCPLMAIPAGFSGKVVFQSVGFPAGGSWELSTPVTVELF